MRARVKSMSFAHNNYAHAHNYALHIITILGPIIAIHNVLTFDIHQLSCEDPMFE